jgi:hypothetical protein
LNPLTFLGSRNTIAGSSWLISPSNRSNAVLPFPRSFKRAEGAEGAEDEEGEEDEEEDDDRSFSMRARNDPSRSLSMIGS